MPNAFGMIDESIWRRDQEFRALPRHAQCTFLQLLSQRDVDCAGVLTLHVDLLAKGCDEITASDIHRDLKTLEAARFIYVDDDTDELLIRSYVRRVTAKSPNALKSALKVAVTLTSPKLRHVLAVELRRVDKAAATAVADRIDPGEPHGQNPSEPHPKGIPNPIPNPSERGNPSERDPEPPSCSSVVDQLSPNAVGHLGGARAREPEPAQPQPSTDAPPRYCDDHMPDGTDQPCGRCKGLRLIHDRWLTDQDLDTKTRIQAEARAEIAARQQAVQDRQQAVTNCQLCDDDGYRGSRVCDHIDRTDTTTRGSQAVRAALQGHPPDPEPITTDPDEPPY